MKETTFSEIAEVLRSHSRIAVLAHTRPDGDAIGSQLALGLALRELGKEALIINNDGVPDRLGFLPGSDQVIVPKVGETVDVEVVVALDTANRARLGANALACVAGAKIVINIDHHVSNERYGDLVYVDDTAPATGEILCDFLQTVKWPITPAVRDNLWVAMSTDTGSFQYAQTTAKTLRMAADLVELGVDVGKISELTFDTQPFRRIELLRELLKVLKLHHDGAIASWALPREWVDKYGLRTEDNEGLINIIRGIDSVKVAVFFEEGDDGGIRVSMRSKTVDADVSRICGVFGGGGHRLAAGARIEGTLEEVETLVIQTIEDVIKQHS